jgi:SAM-dependent methyltransferase
VILVNDVAPTNSPVDLAERGGLRPAGSWVPLANYEPIATTIPDASQDLVSCYIGLHHIPLERLDPFIASIRRILKPGGAFVLRDHDVTTTEMDRLVSLAHTVFNAGLGAPWESNAAELRFFVSIAEWSRRLEAHGLKDSGKRIAQAHDPTDNLLLAFTKEGA